ncbi:MAG: DUF1684 domain-containing protein [Deinococcales bacterium]
MNLEQFRAEKDQFFRSRNSPLKPELRVSFAGLAYFPPNPALRFVCTFIPDPEQSATVMQTSSGSERVYLRLGWLEFLETRLAAFIPEGTDDTELFIPFRDATSGSETYGSGRYLEARLHNGTVELDFNLAYNPYCAYSDGWSCPIPPLENWLKIPILAGEKNFQKPIPQAVRVGGDDD